MKRFFLLIALTCSLVATTALAGMGDKTEEDEILRQSKIFEPNPFINNSSYPLSFAETTNLITNPAISTGYYFVDSDDDAPDFWRPTPEIVDTGYQASLWRRIIPGPRILPPSYWQENPNEGLRFFRNPANGDFFDNLNQTVDSTDNAIAGPIPIGFGFYFNGLRFDSFYVSTNGVIALTNRRYFYNTNGERYVPGGATSAYDPMSMDWFDAARNRTYADDPTDALNGPGTGDALADDYGYRYAVCGNAYTTATAGIRRAGGALNGFPNKTHVIAPCFGEMHLSQYYPDFNMPDDYGKVYFKRSVSADKLIIYFVNIAPKGAINTPYGGYTGGTNLRPGQSNYISANVQVTLNRLDSSATIVFERFDGIAIVSGRGVPAATIFRYNTTVGVRGFARHVNYRRPEGISTTDTYYPWAPASLNGEYEQFTHYYSNYANPTAVYPHPYLAIRFKQWQNTLRVVDIQYRIRKPDANASLDYSEQVKSTEVNDYELLAGEERIGSIQPVAILQNLTNEIQGPQGVNFVYQNHFSFRSRFRIVNEASGKIIYNRLVPIDSSCLILSDTNSHLCTGDPDVKVKFVSVENKSGNYTATPKKFPRIDSALIGGIWKKITYGGIPPYEFVQVYFPPFSPNEYLETQVGRMRAYIIADPTEPNRLEPLGDEWPFDDTTSVRLFVMKRLEEFSDDVREFHIIDRVPMPNVLKWVNIEGEVAPGDEISDHALPPRGEYAAQNNPAYKLQSPVIRLNRVTLARQEPTAPYTGDQLRSFPIDMRGRYKSVLSLSIQRTAKQDDWPRGWCDQQLIGPEPRTVINGNPFTVWTTVATSAANPFNEIDVDIADPSPDGITQITNIPDKSWINHPRRGGAKPVTDVSCLAVYGAGGYSIGFLETDKDSTLEKPSGNSLNSLRPNLYDDGIDFEFNKFFIAIPDTFIRAKNEGAKNFRFRVNVKATNDKKCITCIPDDDDPFFIDNIKILFPPEITDIEMSTIKVGWPYTLAPATQCTEIPIKIKVSNTTFIDAPRFQIKLKIFRGTNLNPEQNPPIYCRTVVVSNLQANKEVEVIMPSWNARNAGPGQYRLQGMIVVDGGDLEQSNDTTYTDFKITFGDAFAYDPTNARNDVPDQAFTGIPGRGLNLFGFAVGGYGTTSGLSTPAYDPIQHAAGWIGGSGSGQIAMKFVLANQDTIFGYKAFFGTLSQGMDDIAYSIYTDQGGRQPGQLINSSLVYKYRGFDDPRQAPFYDEYVTSLLQKPVVLSRGTYWMVIAQLGETGLELGASKSRVGMRTTSIYVPPPGTIVAPLGGSGIHLVIEKTFRKLSNAKNLVNDNFFAFENTRGNGQWAEFMPSTGNPAYAHMDHFGRTYADNTTYTLSRGTWIPLIRPYFGIRAYKTDNKPQICADDSLRPDPVELLSFDGEAVNNGIQLYWSTASEINNQGFSIERKVFADANSDWTSIGYVNGNLNSRIIRNYSFIDNKVALNTTYQYRLRQQDIDGTVNCPDNKIVTVVFDKVGTLSLEQNSPNPFTNTTKIAFNLPKTEQVKLEVLDIYGNVVKTLINEQREATRHEVVWDGFNDAGAQVATGTYIYRLTAGEEISSAKMSLVR